MKAAWITVDEEMHKSNESVPFFGPTNEPKRQDPSQIKIWTKLLTPPLRPKHNRTQHFARAHVHDAEYWAFRAVTTISQTAQGIQYCRFSDSI